MGLKLYGAMIRAARRKAEVHQEELGEVLGVTRAAVSHCEMGKYDIIADDAGRMEALLSVLPELNYDALLEALNTDLPDDPVPRKKRRSPRPPVGQRDVVAGRYAPDHADAGLDTQREAASRQEASGALARLVTVSGELDNTDVEALLEAALIMKSPRGARTELRFEAMMDGAIRWTA